MTLELSGKVVCIMSKWVEMEISQQENDALDACAHILFKSVNLSFLLLDDCSMSVLLNHLQKLSDLFQSRNISSTSLSQFSC